MAKSFGASTKKKGANNKSAAKNLHVVRRAAGWIIRNEGSTRARSLHATQREAVEAGRALAKRDAITLVIHGRDGRVKARNSFNRDPMPPREPRKVLYPTTAPRTASKDAIKRAVREAIAKAASEALKKDKNQQGVVRTGGPHLQPRAGSKRDSRREQVKA